MRQREQLNIIRDLNVIITLNNIIIEMSTGRNIRRKIVDIGTIALSEVFSTCILVFITCLGSVPNMALENISIVQAAITSGMAVMITIFIFGHISGAHVNPSVSLAAVICGHLSVTMYIVYVVSQLIGSIAGYGLIRAITPYYYIEKDMAVCVNSVSNTITLGQAYLTEFLLSLVLVWANCACWDERNKNKNDSAPLKFGFLIAALTFAGAGYTGASMNPARSFAPALWNTNWENHWVYWAGPFSAGIFGGLVYRFVFSKNVTVEKSSKFKTSTQTCNFSHEIVD